jgi:hypothetical protein
MTLEPTASAAEVGAHLGLGRTAVHHLRCAGERFGRELDPLRGGLWPSFRAGLRRRRFPVAAIERHKEHLRRLEVEPAFVARQVERARALGMVDEAAALERRLAQLMRLGAAQREAAA